MALKDLVSLGQDFIVEQVDRAYGGLRQLVLKVDGATGNVLFGVGGQMTVFPSGKTAKLALTDQIADPGNAGAISVATNGTVILKSAGAETRTLAAPTFVGQRIALIADTLAGNVALTVSAAYNNVPNTIITFSAAGQAAELIGVTIAGALRWRLAFVIAAALS